MSDEVIVVDINKLKLRDLEDLAEFIGTERMAALTKGDADPKTLVGLAWIVKRQDNPEFTLEDARDLPLSALNVVNGSGVDPTGNGGSESSPPSVSSPG